MHGDVIGPVTLDFVLRLILARVAGVPLVLGIARMNFDDPAADLSGFGIPADVIADFEFTAAQCDLRPLASFQYLIQGRISWINVNYPALRLGKAKRSRVTCGRVAPAGSCKPSASLRLPRPIRAAHTSSYTKRGVAFFQLI